MTATSGKVQDAGYAAAVLPASWHGSFWYALRRTPWRRTLAAAILVLLLLAISFARSIRSEDRIVIPIGPQLWSTVRAQGGQVGILVATTSGPRTFELASFVREGPAIDWHLYSWNAGGQVFRLHVAHWLLASAAVSVILLCHLRGYLWLRGMRGNRCRVCRYDLTGNVSGVCPECGTEIRTATGMEQS